MSGYSTSCPLLSRKFRYFFTQCDPVISTTSYDFCNRNMSHIQYFFRINIVASIKVFPQSTVCRIIHEIVDANPKKLHSRLQIQYFCPIFDKAYNEVLLLGEARSDGGPRGGGAGAPDAAAGKLCHLQRGTGLSGNYSIFLDRLNIEFSGYPIKFSICFAKFLNPCQMGTW